MKYRIVKLEGAVPETYVIQEYSDGVHIELEPCFRSEESALQWLREHIGPTRPAGTEFLLRAGGWVRIAQLVPTSELKPGMIVYFADLEDLIIAVEPEPDPCVIVTVRVKRRGQLTHFYTGKKAVQLIDEETL